jgi:hypothetical protein
VTAAGLNPHAEHARLVVECNDRAFRRLADAGRDFTDSAVRFAEVVVGIMNAAPLVIFSVAEQSTRGRDNAAVMGGRWRDDGIAAVFSSDLHRSLETATIGQSRVRGAVGEGCA